ncbi:hypothetical protein L6452_41940 [Arctium lappa]|uniref:Uncharacterized protein n=1 Tax=Arctium lappa TaxID=4217 RepID=A0ACB8XIN1_ARCLA|nr:hypothetical protein L6452_41940 [Arctium lappa]
MLLAKQQEAGKALMAEDEYWMDHSNEEEDEEEKDEAVNMCLMGKIESDTEADSENEEEEKQSDVDSDADENHLLEELSPMLGATVITVGLDGRCWSCRGDDSDGGGSGSDHVRLNNNNDVVLNDLLSATMVKDVLRYDPDVELC